MTSRIRRWKIPFWKNPFWKNPFWKNPFWKNPVIIKEMRTRMRGNRAFILFTIHLLILGATVALIYLVFRSSLASTSALEERRIFGKAIFGLLIWIEMIMVSFVAPGLTSGAISAERERQTFDLLRVTPLPARLLVTGKYISGLVFILLLLFTSLPLQSPAFLIGGVLPEEIFIATLILLVTAVSFCAISIFLSSLIPRTLISTVLSYAFAILMIFGIPMIFMIILLLYGALLGNSYEAINPIMKVLLIFIGWLLVSVTPLATIVATETILLEQNNAFLTNIPIGDGIQIVLPSPWIPYVLIYLSLSMLLLWLSVQLTEKLEE